MEWLARLYARRIINVNVNIIAAGILALAFTAAFMHFFVAWQWDHAIANFLGFVSYKVVITAVTFLVDLVADLGVYYILHWYANHAPSRFGAKVLDPELAEPSLGSDLAEIRQSLRPSFLRDATKVQVQRIILSPILYIIALGGQHALLHAHVNVAAATAIGFGAGILVTRILHTLYMLREDRLARAAAQVALAARRSPDGTNPTSPTTPAKGQSAA